MGYDWEFDGSVDFAPPSYRMEKYKECEEAGTKMLNSKKEEDALAYLDIFKYIDYLADSHLKEIYNWQKLVGFEEMALTLLKSREAIFKWVIYPQQFAMWKEEFNHLRELEKQVDKSISTSTYKELIKQFNTKFKKINTQNHKYGFAKHTLYWVQSYAIKEKIRQTLDYKSLDKNEKIAYLKIYGVVEPRDYYGG